MKNNVKEFFKRGMMFSGLGPIILGIIYLILEKTVEGFDLSGYQVFTAILSTYMIAFVQAGASVFNQIEEWPIAKSMLFHFSSIYAVYVLSYVINSWIPFKVEVVLLFTAVFAAIYLAVWLTVYVCIKIVSQKLNSKIKKAL